VHLGEAHNLLTPFPALQVSSRAPSLCAVTLRPRLVYMPR
jgi:hypothetical protein